MVTSDTSTSSSDDDSIRVSSKPPTALRTGNDDIPVAQAKHITFGSKERTRDDDADTVDSDNSDSKLPTHASARGLGDVQMPNDAMVSFGSFKYHPASRSDMAKQDSFFQPRQRRSANPSVDFAASTTSNKNCLTDSTVQKRRSVLSLTSKLYDIDGDGALDEAEQAMRDMDKENKGYLTKEQVYEIVKEQMDVAYDYRQYKKITLALTAFMVLLTLSNFATSFTSAILAQELKADQESGAVLVKETGETIGFDAIAETFDFVPLTDEEYAERRERVLREMSEDIFHEDHMHRHLKNKKGRAKVAFDQGKVLERDLTKIVDKCDGSNTVNIRRSWPGINGDEDADYDCLCGPGTTVTKKQKGKTSRKVGKVRVVTEQIVFSKKGPRKDRGFEETEVVAFTCEKGWCHGSGSILQQSEGHPCFISRGHDECIDGLLCYAGEGITRGTGVCTRFARFRKVGQLCDISLGLDGCVAGATCVGNVNSNVVVDDVSGALIGMGMCTKTIMRAQFGQICDASYRDDSCLDGLVCMDVNGRVLQSNAGTGVCGKAVTRSIDYHGARWYVDYHRGTNHQGQCVRDCPVGNFNNCGGSAGKWDEFFDGAEECCEQKLWWMTRQDCVPDWPIL